MDEAIYGLLIIATLAFILLLADRHIRLSRYIEPFQGSNGTQCGVDMAPCNFPLRCINGYCNSGRTPHLPVSSGLPVTP
jgi:hypothetical protein